MSRKSRPDQPKPPGGARRAPPENGGADEREKPERPDPTRYGDWEIDGRCIDF
jgi:hypothetical protein